MHRRLPAVLVLVAGSAFAADGGASPSPLQLSLLDTLHLAADRAPAVALAKKRIDVARGRLLGVAPWLATNPNVSVGAAARLKPVGGATADFDASVSQAFELGGQQGARRD